MRKSLSVSHGYSSARMRRFLSRRVNVLRPVRPSIHACVLELIDTITLGAFYLIVGEQDHSEIVIPRTDCHVPHSGTTPQLRLLGHRDGSDSGCRLRLVVDQSDLAYTKNCHAGIHRYAYHAVVGTVEYRVPPSALKLIMQHRVP